jgi:hypothetical protein
MPGSPRWPLQGPTEFKDGLYERSIWKPNIARFGSSRHNL